MQLDERNERNDRYQHHRDGAQARFFTLENPEGPRAGDGGARLLEVPDLVNRDAHIPKRLQFSERGTGTPRRTRRSRAGIVTIDVDSSSGYENAFRSLAEYLTAAAISVAAIHPEPEHEG